MRKWLIMLSLAGASFADLYIPCAGAKLGKSSCTDSNSIAIALLALAVIVFLTWKFWLSKKTPVSKAKKK